MIQLTRLGMASLMVVGGLDIAGARQVNERQHEEAARHFKRGMEALASERYDAAEQEFRGAVKQDPLYDAAFYGLGQVYMATKRYERAVQAYLDSRAAYKQATANEALDRAASDRRLRDQIQALKDYVRNMERQIAVTRSPSVQQAIDRNNDQIRQLEMRVGRKAGDAPPPVPAGLSMALGSAYFRLNKLADAEREYKAAIEVNPRFGEAHNNLAVVYLMTGRLDDAERSVAAAKAAGFQVNPQLERDIKSRRSGSSLRRIAYRHLSASECSSIRKSCGGGTSGPRRLGLTGGKRHRRRVPDGPASARVCRSPVHNRFSNGVSRCVSAESTPTRLGTPPVPFSTIACAPWPHRAADLTCPTAGVNWRATDSGGVRAFRSARRLSRVTPTL